MSSRFLCAAVQREKGEVMTRAMSREECERALAALDGRIDGYARLLVRKGLAVRGGQEVVIQSPVECADFARRVTRESYREGAGHVTLIWSDDAVLRLEYENVPLSYFEHTPAWKAEQLNSLALSGACFLFIEGRDPEALAGIDPVRPATAARARNRDCRPLRDGMDMGRNAWCIAGAPVRAWARKVFPGLSGDEAYLRLWENILKTSRADGSDPQQEWERHNATFEKNKRFLNEQRFDRLHYRSENGTNLVIGLNPNGIWEGGAGRTVDGTVFFPNIPTEEVFTSPNRLRVDGVVHSALPLVHSGQLVEDFWIAFEGGRVSGFDARRGREVLKSIIETDEGSCRLGECALVSKDTPIRKSGILFYDTLYDENASCHLALGMGFPECVEGGTTMSEEELLAAGINRSSTHVDFMVGSDDMDIRGIRPDGREVPVFKNGRWAWEANA